MKKIKSLFKENYHIVVLSVMVIAVFYVFIHSGLFSDDSNYRRVAVCDWPEIFQFLKWHIINFNGRTLVHFFVILFLRREWTIELWRVFATAAFCIVPVLCAKMISDGKKISKPAVLLTVFFLTSTFPYVWDSSVYWLSGSFNYLFPSVLLLTAMLCSVKKPDSLWIIPLAFLSGATTDQTGLMTIGFFVLMGIDRAINQKKVSVKSIIFFLSACAGYAMILICPGTYARFTNQGGMGAEGFIYNLIKIIRIRWIDNMCITTLTICIVFFVVFWLLRFKTQTRFTKILNPVLAVSLSVSAALNLLLKAVLLAGKLFNKTIVFSQTVNKAFFALWLVYAALLIGSLLLSGFYIYLFLKKPLPLISVILAYGSQFMMAAASQSMYRACIPALFMIYIFMSFSLTELIKSEKIQSIRNKSMLTAAFVILCVISCAFQAVTGLHCVYKSEPFNPEPMNSSEMTAFTDKLGEENKLYYTGTAWQEKIDLFDFSKLYF